MLCSRSLSLQLRYDLHEPIETNIFPYFAWRLRIDNKNQLKEPKGGIVSLEKYLQDQKRSFGKPYSLPKNTNVLLTVLESFGAKTIEEQPALAPFLVELKNHPNTVYLNNHFTSCYRTIGALYSLWCSKYDPLPFYVIRDYPHSKQRCLPAIFDEQGYETIWLSGNNPGFDYQEKWSTNNGIQKFFSSLNLAVTKTHGSMGVEDKYLFEESSKILDDAKKPFFATMLSISNHHPFDFDRNVPGLLENPSIFEKDFGYYYTDFYLKKFFDKIKQSSWFSNTLVIITGDHPSWSYEPKTENNYIRYQNSYKTFTLMHHPMFDHKTIEHMTSHIDIPNTILELLNIQKNQRFFGTNLFYNDPDRTILMQDNQRNSFFQIMDQHKIIRSDAQFAKCNSYSKNLDSTCNTDENILIKSMREIFLDTTQWEVFSEKIPIIP